MDKGIPAVKLHSQKSEGEFLTGNKALLVELFSLHHFMVEVHACHPRTWEVQQGN